MYLADHKEKFGVLQRNIDYSKLHKERIEAAFKEKTHSDKIKNSLANHSMHQLTKFWKNTVSIVQCNTEVNWIVISVGSI
jgi:hypothetical protein